MLHRTLYTCKLLPQSSWHCGWASASCKAQCNPYELQKTQGNGLIVYLQGEGRVCVAFSGYLFHWGRNTGDLSQLIFELKEPLLQQLFEFLVAKSVFFSSVPCFFKINHKSTTIVILRNGAQSNLRSTRRRWTPQRGREMLLLSYVQSLFSILFSLYTSPLGETWEESQMLRCFQSY